MEPGLVSKEKVADEVADDRQGLLCLDFFLFCVCESVTDFWFVVTMRLIYSSLYIYIRDYFDDDDDQT